MAAKPPNKYGIGECHGECGDRAVGLFGAGAVNVCVDVAIFEGI
jgi:hypothetical protein